MRLDRLRAQLIARDRSRSPEVVSICGHMRPSPDTTSDDEQARAKKFHDPFSECVGITR